MPKFHDEHIPSTHLPRVIIIGAGFGGIRAAKELIEQRFQVVLFDKNNYHLFQPLLYQVATGGLEPGSIAYPIRKIFKGYNNFYFRLAEVNQILPENNVIITSIGSFHYDYLIIATGSTTNFYGLKDIKEHSFAMKSISQALDLRSILIQNMEEAVLTTDKKKLNRLMNYVIVGGGPTGVELAGALAELRRHVLKNDYHEIDIPMIQIHLLEAASGLLNGMSPTSGKRAQKFLEKMGVDVWLEAQVESYDGNLLRVNEEFLIETDTVIWTAGVTGKLIKGFNKPSYNKSRRMLVNNYNQVHGYHNVFAIGDVAAMIADDLPNGHPMIAPVSIQQGKNTAINIQRLHKSKEPRPFKYRDKGSMATIGRNKAVAELAGLKFFGFTAWVIWMAVHLISLIGFRNKLMVFLDWVWNYISFDKALRLIIRPYSKYKYKRNKNLK